MIETKTEDYKSHKHTYNVYVEINSKTKLGQNLLDQYHKQAKYQYIDIGRIGYHDKYGRYIITHYDIFELISIPKLVIRVTKKAIDRAGYDEYILRTYMSKFGQLNFILLVDQNSAELILVENVFIENLNYRETYETSIYKLKYSSSHPVPLKEIFYKFNIRANADDYSKAFKAEELSLNNLIMSKAKAALTIKIANEIASSVNQKALLTSLNYLNKEGSYGKNVTKEYSKNVSKSKQLNELTTSPKLESTLNNVLIKTLEQQTTKTDVKDKTNLKLYKKVLDVQMSSHIEVKKEVNKLNTKQNLKDFLLDTYQKHETSKKDELTDNEEKFKAFENIIQKQYVIKPNLEQFKPIEEDFKVKQTEEKVKQNLKPKKAKNKIKEEIFNFEYFDFDNKKIDIDFNTSRFNAKEDSKKKQIDKQLEKLEKKQAKKNEKQLKIQNKKSKILNAECNLDEEFEKSKLTLGLNPNASKHKRKKALKIYFSSDVKKAAKEKHKTKESNKKQLTLNNLETNNTDISNEPNNLKHKHKNKKEQETLQPSQHNSLLNEEPKTSILSKLEKLVRNQKLLTKDKKQDVNKKFKQKTENKKIKNTIIKNINKNKKQNSHETNVNENIKTNQSVFKTANKQPITKPEKNKKKKQSTNIYLDQAFYEEEQIKKAQEQSVQELTNTNNNIKKQTKNSSTKTNQSALNMAEIAESKASTSKQTHLAGSAKEETKNSKEKNLTSKTSLNYEVETSLLQPKENEDILTPQTKNNKLTNKTLQTAQLGDNYTQSNYQENINNTITTKKNKKQKDFDREM